MSQCQAPSAPGLVRNASRLTLALGMSAVRAPIGIPVACCYSATTGVAGVAVLSLHGLVPVHCALVLCDVHECVRVYLLLAACSSQRRSPRDPSWRSSMALWCWLGPPTCSRPPRCLVLRC